MKVVLSPRRWSAVLCLLLLITTLQTPAVAGAEALVYEAETGALNGVQVESATPGYSGTGYVGGFDAADDSVTITISDSPGGLYDLTVRYSAPFGTKNANLRLNDAGLGEVTLPETASFASAGAGKVLLKAGDNTITVVNGWGWYHIDAISLTPVPPPPPHQVTGELNNPDATAEAKGLMRYLAAHYGKDLISGQQDMASIQWVEDNVGSVPAIAGLDMMDYSPSRVERGTTSRETDNALAWDRRGGMVTFVWHWNAPSGLIDQPGKEWWRGFYTEATTFDLAAALADTGSADYALLIRDIDAIAVQLKRLQDAGVPVLWRPLHEAEGGWFWWGAKGAGPAKELYRLMYERLTGHHHLNNLVWVWNSVSPDWYPGDDVVDVLSVDSYPPQGDHGPVSGPYERLVALGQDRKPVALGEVGSIPDPELTRAYHADWSFFVTWSGGFISDGVSNSLPFLKKVYTDPHVITLDELGDFKGYGSGCVATFRATTTWGQGFLGEVTVKNTDADASTEWTVGWTLPDGQSVVSHWNADLSVADGRVTAANAAWNGSLRAGASTTFGFLGRGAATPPTRLTCTAD
ncbi:glycosyl hydrolase [Streptosporangium soli]|nr:cellulose binding domain-containing protein [Streptosporangium sp. KLBMP 9127]